MAWRRLLLAGASLVVLGGCDDGPATPSRSELTDPGVAPRVIATYPTDGGTGPFELFTSGDYVKPHCIVQLNKLVNRLAFDPAWFEIEGFDRPVRARLLELFRYPADAFPRAASNDLLIDVLGIAIHETEDFRSANYAVGRTYAVTVGTALEDATGRHPVQPYRFTFLPEPYFRVAAVTPEHDADAIGPTANVLVAFNGEIDATIAPSLRMLPSISGRWSIATADAHVATFQHLEPFAFGTTYSVDVVETAADVHGNRLREPFTSTFHVVPFDVRFAYPPDGATAVAVTAGVGVQTSGPLDSASVRQAFHIEPVVAGQIRHESSGFGFIPSADLELGTRYGVTISTALRALDGTPLAAPFHLSFTTVGFGIEGSSPGDGQVEVPRNLGVWVYSNAMLDPGSLLAAFQISPTVRGNLSTPTGGRAFLFSPDAPLQPATIYTVTISTALRTTSGIPLAAPYTFAFRTGGL